MARKTKEEARETRAAIQKAALALFATRGISETTLSDVARTAGVTRGAIYWHFENKEALLRSLRDETCLPYEQIALAGEKEDEPDPLGRLRDMLRALIEDAAESGVTRQVFQIWLDRGRLGIKDRGENAQEEEERRHAAIRKTESILKNAVRQGQLPKNFDIRLGAVSMMSFIDGTIVAVLLAPASRNIKNDILRLIDAFLFAMQADNNPYLLQEPTA